MKTFVKTRIYNFWITRILSRCVSIYDPRNWYGAPPVHETLHQMDAKI